MPINRPQDPCHCALNLKLLTNNNAGTNKNLAQLLILHDVFAQIRYSSWAWT